MALDPAYASVPNCSGAIVVTADTSRTAPNPTNTPVIWTAGANGGRLERIAGQALGDTTGSMIRLWWFDPVGVKWYLFEEVAVTPVVVSSTQAGYGFTRETVTTPSKMPKLVPAGWQLRSSINDTQAGGGVMLYAEGGNF